MSHSLACRHWCNRICHGRYHPPGEPIEPCVHPHAKYHLFEEALIREIADKNLEPWRRVPSTMCNSIAYKAGDLRILMMMPNWKSRWKIGVLPWSALRSSKMPKALCSVLNSCQKFVPPCLQPPSPRDIPFRRFQTILTQLVPLRTQLLPKLLGIGPSIEARATFQLSACVLNLGHWERSRKRSTPQCFHHLIDWSGTYREHKEDPTCGNLFLHFLSNIGAHVLLMQEASTIRQAEETVLEERGWMIATSPDRTLLCAARANPWPGSYIHHIAGARTIKRHKETPLSNAIFEACFGDEPRREEWERAGWSSDKEAQRDLLREDNPAKDKIIGQGCASFARVHFTWTFICNVISSLMWRTFEFYGCRLLPLPS